MVERMSKPSLDKESLRLRLKAVCPSEADVPLSAVVGALVDDATVPVAWPPERDSTGIAIERTGGGVPAAVLIGLVARPEGPTIILTERTAHLANHAAQVSLPGGRVEAADAGPAAAALREALEEVGLNSAKVELLGCLPPLLTTSGFCVYPFVGWIDPPVELLPDPYEVAEIFEMPLQFVLERANHHRDSLVARGVRHEFYVLPYLGHRVWGATADILVGLADALAP